MSSAIIGDAQLFEVDRNNYTEFVSDYTEAWTREKTHWKSKGVLQSKAVYVLSKSHVHQQETPVIQLKDTCSLANHLSVISDAWAILFSCLQLNLWQPLPFYFLRIKTQPPFLLKAWGLLILAESTVSFVFLSQSTKLPSVGFSGNQVQSCLTGTMWPWFLSSLSSVVVSIRAVSQLFFLFQKEKQDLCVEAQ